MGTNRVGSVFVYVNQPSKITHRKSGYQGRFQACFAIGKIILLANAGVMN